MYSSSTSLIWCLRGNASRSSQWALLACHEAMKAYDVKVKWAPGHTGITGNDEADRLAKSKARNLLTSRRGGTTFHGLRYEIHRSVHAQRRPARLVVAEATQFVPIVQYVQSYNMSQSYNQWGLYYIPGKAPEELRLPHAILLCFLALRSSNGDFAWYHRRFNHEDADTKCSCGIDKTPNNIVHCRKTTSLFT